MKYKFFKKQPTYDCRDIWEGYVFYLPRKTPLESLQRRFQQYNIETTLMPHPNHIGWNLHVVHIPDELIGKVEVI